MAADDSGSQEAEEAGRRRPPPVLSRRRREDAHRCFDRIEDVPGRGPRADGGRLSRGQLSFAPDFFDPEEGFDSTLEEADAVPFELVFDPESDDEDAADFSDAAAFLYDSER